MDRLKAISTHRPAILILMLLALHAAVYLELEGAGPRLLLFCALGLFLMWQRLWQQNSRLAPLQAAGALAAALVAVMLINWYLVALMLAILFGLLGGKAWAHGGRRGNPIDLAAMLYVLAVLLLWVVPHLFAAAHLPDATRFLMRYLLPASLLLLLLLPRGETTGASAEGIDFFYSLMLLLLALVLVLGSYCFMMAGGIGYLEALMRTVLLIGMLLFAWSWLWNPGSGFRPLQSLFSKYLIDINAPFEMWLEQLALIAQNEPNASLLVEKAAEQLAQLPWLAGIEWSTAEACGKHGDTSAYCHEHRSSDLNLRIWRHSRANPAAALQLRLQAQIIGHFFEAKKRERQLANITRMQAIFETGSRLTHDMKNLLQSLYTLTQAAAAPDDGFKELLSGQLPELAKRIELTLAKLHSTDTERCDSVEARLWWENLKQRFAGRNIVFWEEAIDSRPIPGNLFDCAAENLIGNSREKRLNEPGITISVRFSLKNGAALTVCDTGSCVPANRAARLFLEPLPSDTGLGVGLFQLQLWARRHGCELSLCRNDHGSVCFEFRQNG